MDLNSILSKLGVGSGKELVYMSITPGIGLEIVQLDSSAKIVKNYAYRPLEYNESLREISDIDAFKNAVSELYAELNINPKCNVVINLPMVMLGSKELPLILDDAAVNEALMSEVEQSYIFKRYEPVIGWCDSETNQAGDSRKLFYSAIQKNVIDDVKLVLSELGSRLVSVEISLMSLLKSLVFLGLAEDQIKDGISWNLMVVNQTGYSICSMLGKKLVDYYEEPLAIKSFEGDEVYSAINASAQIALMSYPANYLYVVSETDLVSASTLSSGLQVDGTVKYIDNNTYKEPELLPVSVEVPEEISKKISLEIVGTASGVTLPNKFNFMGSESELIDDPNEPVHIVIGTKEFNISPNTAALCSAIIAGLVIIPALILAISLPLVVKHKQSQLDDIQAKLTSVQEEVQKLQNEQNKTDKFDINAEITKVMGQNRTKLMGFIALGESVPKNLWLTYFLAKDDSKFDIKGHTSNVEDVYKFYKNMKDSLVSVQLRLSKLEMKSDSNDDISINGPSDYEFEITNMSESDFDTEMNSDNSESDQSEENPEDNNSGGLLNKPLLNFGKIGK